LKIGLISDTHGHLDDAIYEQFSGCDEIWHAGDFGSDVAEKLSEKFILRGVYGNIDDQKIRNKFPEHLWMTVAGLKIWITHIAGTPPKYKPGIKAQLKTNSPDILICGHSHITRIGRDENYQNMLFINPGAAGHHGFHSMRTIITFHLSNGKIEDLRVIELGKRGVINTDSTY
jgi:putative phosphoesterase